MTPKSFPTTVEPATPHHAWKLAPPQVWKLSGPMTPKSFPTSARATLPSGADSPGVWPVLPA
ncbi:hypothetical protein GCM10009583_05250 [Ornithinicoccus hortensis]